jgi:hypothetical protein
MLAAFVHTLMGGEADAPRYAEHSEERTNSRNG